MDHVLATIRREEVEPALRLLSVYERDGRIDPRQAAEWGTRITAWARFNQVGTETEPSA
jgi:hypothetical protein